MRRLAKIRLCEVLDMLVLQAKAMAKIFGLLYNRTVGVVGGLFNELFETFV
jgi:hypothetical protein